MLLPRSKETRSRIKQNKGKIIFIHNLDRWCSGELTDVKHVRFQALTAASIKMTVFLVVAPCSIVEIDRRHGRSYCFNHQANDNGGIKYL
jgi:hypothetical protein